MACLVEVFRLDDHPPLKRRQSPLMIEDQLMMVMDLNKLDLVREKTATLKHKQIEEFCRKFRLLSESELKSAFQITVKDIINILGESIPCVGCRRSVERLFYQLMDIGQMALDPLQVKPDGTLIVKDQILKSPRTVCSIFADHNERLNNLVESQPRSKKSRRCVLHSWDLQKTRPVTPAWKEVWAVMHEKCKSEVLLIDFSLLLSKLEDYLKKHRFCTECRTKVMKAYNLLIDNEESPKEKGFVPMLYQKIKRCLPGKHIHLPTETSFIDSLIARAEPELLGSRRERHAKTMEIAQEEVLTCVGICIYDRLHRIFIRLREEEFTCRVLAAVSVQALHRNFETAVEKKRGITQLELLCQELKKEELAKQQRKESKKLKKKRKREKKHELVCERKKKLECERLERERVEGEKVEDEKVEDEKVEDEKVEDEKVEDEKVEDESMDVTVCEPRAGPLKRREEEMACECPKVESPENGDRHKLQILDRKGKGPLKCLCTDCSAKNKAEVEVEETSQTWSQDTAKSQEAEPANESSKEDYTQTNPTESGDGGKSLVRGGHNPSVCRNVKKRTPPQCHSCQWGQQRRRGGGDRPRFRNDHSQDYGYSSEQNAGCCEETLSPPSSRHSSPEGSEVACSEGFCEHEGECTTEKLPEVPRVVQPRPRTYSDSSQSSSGLEELVEEILRLTDDEEDCWITPEEIEAFRPRAPSWEQRLQFREVLKQRFAQLCMRSQLPKT